MEADLARFYSIDYRDRWRRSPSGRPELTLRRLAVLVRHLPPESSVAFIARDKEMHWSVEAQLLDDLRMVWTGTKDKPAKPHPKRPTPGRARRKDPARARKLADAKRRARERRRAIAAGEIT